MPWFHKLTELAAGGTVEPAKGRPLPKEPPKGVPSPMLLIPRGFPIPRAILLGPLPPIPELILRARSFAKLIVSRSLGKSRQMRGNNLFGRTCSFCQLVHSSPPVLPAPSQSTGRGSSSSGRQHVCARTAFSPSSRMSLFNTLSTFKLMVLPALVLMRL